jgi:hypothetical protein
VKVLKFQITADVHAIEIHDREKCSPGSSGGTLEARKCLVHDTISRFLVEVSQEYTRCIVERKVFENGVGRQAFSLLPLFRFILTKMNTKNVERTSVSRPGNFRVQAHALLVVGHTERINIRPSNGKAAQNGVAEFIAAHMISPCKHHMEVQNTCNFLPLARAHLLETNDIRVSVTENGSNAITPDAKVETGT